jgi:hypothetical protein
MFNIFSLPFAYYKQLFSDPNHQYAPLSELVTGKPSLKVSQTIRVLLLQFVVVVVFIFLLDPCVAFELMCHIFSLI